MVTPVYKDFEDLDNTEKISFLQMCKVLCAYDIFIVTHASIDVDKYSDQVDCVINCKIFDKSYFADISGYNKLLIDIKFFGSFEGYDYMLITQLDVFVFKNNVSFFTDKGYDYIGAPWFEGFGTASKDSKIIGIGNGGFSLRNINSSLAVLKLLSLFNITSSSPASLVQALKNPITFLKVARHEIIRTKRNYSSILPWLFNENEDLFWCKVIPAFFPWFKVGNVQDAIAFAFEVNADVLFAINGNQLPMGAHAWQKYNVGFWKPFIEKFGYTLE
ncbi:DUF5672 family protein [Hymenobacter sp. GOD-10R]|uniref:DUF5672 family protein n=1 Tax=Hymenobacter sp. GOD-10R TaxID=3093922 RepID=UPI002D787F5C|nr:DUF5672 family protein [Hymenobacter sp. GOD-10R]WRQ27457.1 DUF5672 family protein [Hymenobacter sp. GOD-10R]